MGQTSVSPAIIPIGAKMALGWPSGQSLGGVSVRGRSPKVFGLSLRGGGGA